MLYNLKRCYTATIGTGTLTIGAAILNDFSDIPDGTTVSYSIMQGSLSAGFDAEVGRGTYSAGTLARDTVLSSTSGGAKIALDGTAQVVVTALAEDFVSFSGGVAGRVAAWSSTDTITAGALIPPASNILTLTNAAASTLALNITAAKTLTLTAADNYTLTVPATGTAGLLGTANNWTALNTFLAGGDFRSATVSQAAYTSRWFSSVTAFTQTVGTGPSPTLNNDWYPGTTAALNGYIEITTGGTVGAAKFKWAVTGLIAEVTNVTTASTVALQYGLIASFAAGTYVLGDRWTFTLNPPSGNAFDIKSVEGTQTIMKFDGVNGLTIGNSLLSLGVMSLNHISTPQLKFQRAGTTVWDMLAESTNDGFGILARTGGTKAIIGMASALRSIVIGGTYAGSVQGTTEHVGMLNVLTISDKQGLVVTGFTTQTLPVVKFVDNTAATNTVRNVLKLETQSTGTAANGLGAGLLFTVETATAGTIQSAGRVYTVTTDATNASRKYALVGTAFDTAEREGWRVEADGSAAKIGLYGVATVARATTAGTASTFAANTSGIVDDTATFDNYTIGQVVKALRDIGILT